MSSELLVVNSFVRGYHEYMDVWKPKVNEEYLLKREPSNKTDKNVVAVINECDSGASTVQSRAHPNDVRMNMEVVGHVLTPTK